MYRNMQGITLLELMVVVVIIGVLAVVGYPSYREYSARAQRTEARSMLLRIAADQEKFYLQNSTYANTLTAFGYASNAEPTETGRYRVSVTAGDAAGYTLRADYLGADSEAGKCSWFQVNENGTRTSGPLGADECWSR